MAKVTIPIKVSGLDIIKVSVIRLMDNAKFKPGTSEDYKEGFFDFGKAMVAALDEMRKDEENG